MARAQSNSPTAARRRAAGQRAGPRALSRRQAEFAQQILDYVRRSRFPRGHHLTEEALASKFRVSRTPVRAALRLLAAERVLEARPNQGFFVALTEAEIQSAAIDLPLSADEDLYLRISSDRFEDRLPETITEAALLRRYAVGRPLLLKVLARMSAEGLIQRSRGQGWIFQPILNTTESTEASYRFRLAIEPAGLREATFRLDPEVLSSLRQAHQDLLNARSRQVGASRFFEIDALFHESLAEASGNAFIHQAIQHQNRLRRLSEYRSYYDHRRLATWCREHLAILEALQHGDSETGARLMAGHLENARTFAQAPEARPPPAVK